MKNKHLKKFIYAIIATIFIVKIASKVKDNSIQERFSPNIIFILADDFGIVDSGIYANKFTGTHPEEMYYETPNIDLLANEGVSFSQAYANQLCSPTRASILTGKYAARLGFTTAMPPRKTYYNQKLEVPKGYYLHDVLEHSDPIKIEQALINGISNSAIPNGKLGEKGRDELSIAEALPDYHSAFIGKWHIGGFGAKGYQPKDYGFDALAWYDAGASTYFNWKSSWNKTYDKKFPKLKADEFEIGNSGKKTNRDYLTDDLTAQALQFIEERSKHKEKPFFLYFSHFAVHAPYEGKKKEVTYFDTKKTKGWNGHKDSKYAAMIKHLDYSVGAILQKLKELDLEENTLVIFMSDNGGIDSKITPRGDGTDNMPFLGGKACLTEGGIRVPLIFRWKGKIKKAKWVDIPVDCTDILPTIVEAASYNQKDIITKYDLDGESLIPLLSDISNEKTLYTKNEHYWHYPFNVIYNSPYEPFALTPQSAIRKGDYKLIFDWYGRVHLYNIVKDPYEKNDLSLKIPQLKDKMFKKLMHWLQKNVEKRYWPSLNKSYNPLKEVRETSFLDLFSEYNDNSKVFLEEIKY